MSDLEEKRRKKDKKEEDAASPLTLLRQLLGGLAGITAFVYLTGGLVLGLRLAFAR
jgi:hypothetical protein